MVSWYCCSSGGSISWNDCELSVRSHYYGVSCTGIYCNTGNDAGRKRCLLYLHGRNTNLQYWKYFKTWSGQNSGDFTIFCHHYGSVYYRNMGDSEQNQTWKIHLCSRWKSGSGESIRNQCKKDHH